MKTRLPQQAPQIKFSNPRFLGPHHVKMGPAVNAQYGGGRRHRGPLECVRAALAHASQKHTTNEIGVMGTFAQRGSQRSESRTPGGFRAFSIKDQLAVKPPSTLVLTP
jgi:hypothetical protein